MMWAVFFPGVSMFEKITGHFSLTGLIMFAAAFVIMLFVKINKKPINPILVIVGSGAAGIAVGYINL
jgi:hypothetical protein